LRLPEPLIPGKLIQRYKRFLVDAALDSGEMVTAHCPNSGSMMSLLDSGNPVLLSRSANPHRKLRFTLELLQVRQTWVGVNTMNPNRLIHEALQTHAIPELTNYTEIKKEAVWKEGCRFDFCLKNNQQLCYLEVKNVTLEENGWALFPDAVTKRGAKHLHHLIEVVEKGFRGVMLFLVHRADCERFRPARHIDFVYAETLRAAAERGVEILVYRAAIHPPLVALDRELPFEL
jgi:sugar fermentation stimulation protein A